MENHKIVVEWDKMLATCVTCSKKMSADMPFELADKIEDHRRGIVREI